MPAEENREIWGNPDQQPMQFQEPNEAFAIPKKVLQEHQGWETQVVWYYFNHALTRKLTSKNQSNRFLKMVKKGTYPGIEHEAPRMRWAADFLPVPPILEVNLSEHIPWMLTEEIRGKDGNHPNLKADPIRLVKMLADALSRFHQVPVDNCPFNFRLETALRHSKLRLKAGLIEPKVHFHPEFQHLSAEKAVEILHNERPSHEELVVCHGDFCVPNILFNSGALKGFVDLGELGVADVWWDLAVATWSLEWNLGPGYEDLFLKEYGKRVDSEKIQYYRLLYDVVS